MNRNKDLPELACEIARAWTLPASPYGAPSIFEDEKNKIFYSRSYSGECARISSSR